MEQKRGGKRDGAGRKPSGLEKETVSIFVEKGQIYKFGNKEKLKGKLYDFISEYGVQDLNKPTNEIKPFEQPKSNYSIDVPLSFDKLKDELQNVSEQPTYLSLLKGMSKLLFPDEREEYELKILAATHLSDKQRSSLIAHLKQMR